MSIEYMVSWAGLLTIFLPCDAKQWITQVTPHDIPGTLVYAKDLRKIRTESPNGGADAGGIG